MIKRLFNPSITLDFLICHAFCDYPLLSNAPDAHERSDYDFVVVFDHAKPGRRSDRFFGLLFFLEDNLSEQIDLLEQDAIRNPYLREAIDRDKRLIYESRDQKASILR